MNYVTGSSVKRADGIGGVGVPLRRLPPRLYTHAADHTGLVHTKTYIHKVFHSDLTVTLQ